MRVYRAYKYRLYPTQEQQQTLTQQFGSCRFVYNYFLQRRIDYYTEHKERGGKKGLTYIDTALMLTQLKRQEEYSWLSKAVLQGLQAALADLDKAYNNFFNKRANFPQFKKKNSKQSFRLIQHVYVRGSYLKLPKMRPIKIVLHRPLEGRFKHVTVSRTKGGKYYASLTCELDIPEPEYHGQTLGLDLGLKTFVTTSEGEKVNHPKHYHQAEKRLKHLHRNLSRRQKGSNRRRKARLALARQYEKVSNQRTDFLHKLSRRLVEENQTLYVEDLNVLGMLKNHKLAKSISATSWGQFLWQLEYKGTWYGCRIQKIDRFFPSSKRCHECGYINQSLTLADREWQCPECQVLLDRDINAAINILAFGTAGAAETKASGELELLTR